MSDSIDRYAEVRRMIAPPYLFPHNNRWVCAQLFYETWINVTNKTVMPVFQARGHARPGLIHAKNTFIELGDPTGYQWAIKYLGSWEHWLLLSKQRWFREFVDEWRDELDMKQKAEAIQVIKEIALSSDSKNALPAARYLAERGWDKTSGKGRPTKEQVAAELKHEVRQRTQIDDDAERIGLTMIEGGKSQVG